MITLTVVLTSLVTSAATAGAALYAGAKGYANKWLQSRFDRQLEAFRSEKARELEALKFEASRLLDRATKVHQHEFEVLPALWDKMTVALSATAHLVNRGQRLTKTEGMGEGQLADFVKNLDLPQWEKEEFLALPPEERDDNLWLKLKWMRLRRALGLHGEFQDYFISNSIFLRGDLRAEVRRLSDLNYDALMEFEMALQGHLTGGEEAFAKRAAFLEQWKVGFESVMASVQGHLWISGDGGKDLLEQRDRLLAQADPGGPAVN
jgi:hypothetical protein